MHWVYKQFPAPLAITQPKSFIPKQFEYLAVGKSDVRFSRMINFCSLPWLITYFQPSTPLLLYKS